MSETLKTYNSERTESGHIYTKNRQKTYDLMYFFTVLYLIIDYGRPQDILPISFFRPAMIVILILIFFLLNNLKYQLIRE